MRLPALRSHSFDALQDVPLGVWQQRARIHREAPVRAWRTLRELADAYPAHLDVFIWTCVLIMVAALFVAFLEVG